MKYLFFLLVASGSLYAEDCCNDILQALSQVQGFIERKFPCSPSQVIDHVPFTITEPGKYCVKSDLVYNGSGAAITVSADNVAINFFNHSLTLTNSAAQGILVLNVSEFSLEDDIIQGASPFNAPTSAAVVLQKVQKASLNNVYTKNTSVGVDLELSQDVQITYSQFEAHEATTKGAGVWINGSSDIHMDFCTFNGQSTPLTSYGIHMEGDTNNVYVDNALFINWQDSINVTSVTDLIVDHTLAMDLQLGNANQPIIRNSSFNAILATGGSDGILENCIVEGGLHVNGYSSLMATNCLFTGANSENVYVENGDAIVIDGCQISGATSQNVFLVNATSCVVKNSQVFNGKNGIVIQNASPYGKNVIEHNLVYNNAQTGILVTDMQNNQIIGNTLWGNTTGLEIAFSMFTGAFDNFSCNNSVNCSNVFPNQAPTDSPTQSGTNVCCGGNPPL
jgi:parallel beta-helix repeat protein